MKKISNYYELKAFCLDFKLSKNAKYRTIEVCGNQLRIDSFEKKPVFSDDRCQWLNIHCGCIELDKRYIDYLQFDFDPNFSKCCWATE